MLQIHRAERADVLADALAAILAQAGADPFAAEVVAVPTRGMERWLAQRLSSHLGASPGRADGVCANIEFPFPGTLVDAATSAAAGIDPAADPWRAERLLWPLLSVVDACLYEPWLAPLTTHFAAARPAGADQQRQRRLARVQRIAELYDQYARWRPAMLQAWARGESCDAGGRPLPAANAWQAELWRQLRETIGTPSVAERLEGACAGLREHPEQSRLPARLALFGITRLPASELAVLRALAAHREVNLFVLHPSPELWDRVSADGATSGRGQLPRRRERSARLAANGLLASWGRDSRELQLVLSDGLHAGPQAGEQVASSRHHALREPPAGTLLAQIQADVRANRAPPGSPAAGAPDARLELSEQDRSLQLHSCHGRPRQVQALHEAILHALADDPTLEPRDVIVMCPDIETFAPLITATFGVAARSEQEPDAQAPATGARVELRVRLADRSLRSTNPVLGVVARLLELADARVTASQLLDLLDTDPVRRRFALDDDDLAQIRDWVMASGIHWGLDASHRGSYRLERVGAGTWEAGLDRVMLGVALSEAGGRLFERVLPLGEIDSDAIDLAGRFAELIDRVAVALRELAGPHTIAGWARAIAAAAEALSASGEREQWQQLALRRLLDGLVAEASGAAGATELALSELRALLGARLAGRPTRANFRTGHLTICTLVPMRSVPHRVVCLLGLDDGAFPRHAPDDGDDILLADPRVGDRDARAEDRQMLLDALLAARETLILTYTGNDERTNAPRPAAVVLSELLEVVEATARCERGSARERVLVRHPLQPFDQRNFVRGALVPENCWSFDPVALQGARALRGVRVAPAPLLSAPLGDLEEPVLALGDLLAFVQRPVRAFLRQRLGISIVERDEDVRDGLPVELDALARWSVGERLLAELLSGTEPRAALLAEIARGELPPGELGRKVLQDLWPHVDSIATHARAYAGSLPPRSLETVVALAGGPLLTGSVSGVRGSVLLSVTYSRLGPRHRLAAWVRLLALTAAHPQAPFEAVTIGRPAPDDDQQAVSIAQISPLGRDGSGRRARALSLLAGLVDLRARGLREPLPLPCLTGAAYAQAARSGPRSAALAAAQAAWRPAGWRSIGEDREPEHLMMFGAELPFAELLERAPRADEQGEGWTPQEPSRFVALAWRLWEPLLDCETVLTR